MYVYMYICMCMCLVRAIRFESIFLNEILCDSHFPWTISQTMNPDVFRGPWGGTNCRDSLAQVQRSCDCTPGEQKTCTPTKTLSKEAKCPP